ncbi:ubiquinone biosynthesis protein [Azospirillum fermentarium]|uniref:2-polyprenylphenol 6-hydroxylase n=1 Tax=Azospirillum fermentarium TaxID=1233114 RepID=UPI0022277435|nr:2-polyprenylphenol 6-hydroxylase [Azospirillum fermentarium]MCW2245658.1 ubiquinone biosynthesis protein [Azospirillum fermentarium]
MIGTIRNLIRLAVIGRTLARHNALPETLADVSPGLAFVWRRVANRATPGREGQRLAAALAELGPTFIKLGQALSTRSDLVGERVAADLAELQDKLPPFPGAQARAIIEAELEQPIDALFQSFDDKPVAAASIAQVHFAVTSDGREVAVKVLRPDIERAFTRDIDLFHWLARWAETLLPKLRRLHPRQVVDIFARTSRLEMDLRMEASAASELRDNFADDPTFIVPQVDWDRTAKRVLTLERIHGIKVDDPQAIIAAGYDSSEVLAKASAGFFNQVFRDGFFHADLHPGNLFVIEGGNIAVVDFGIMGRLDRATRTYLADMLIGFLTGDYRRVAVVHFEAGYVPRHQSIELFTQACRAIGEPLLNKPLNEISVGRLLAQLFAVTEQFDMETQPQLLLLQKSMLTAEGVGRFLNPNVNMWELARPLVEEWMRENRGPEAQIMDGLEGALRSVQRLPQAIDGMARITEGGVRLHPDTVRAIVEGRNQRLRASVVPLWIAVAALAVAIAALI